MFFAAEPYDFNKLLKDEVEILNPFTYARKLAREHGDLMALAVLVIYGVKMVVQSIFILLTLVQYGAVAALGLVLRMYMNTYYVYTRVQSYHRRRPSAPDPLQRANEALPEYGRDEAQRSRRPSHDLQASKEGNGL